MVRIICTLSAAHVAYFNAGAFSLLKKFTIISSYTAHASDFTEFSRGPSVAAILGPGTDFEGTVSGMTGPTISVVFPQPLYLAS